jgi:type I restriction enzyme S subunit
MKEIIDTEPESVPGNWETVEVGSVCRIENGCPFESRFFNEREGVPLIRIRDVHSGQSKTLYSGPYDEKYVVNNGDLLVGMDGEFRVRKWGTGKGLLNQRVCRLVPDGKLIDRDFVQFSIGIPLKKIEDYTPYTTVKHISATQIRSIVLPYPPLPEQRQIASVLEVVHQAIEQQERLLALTAELKNSLLHQLFTRGLHGEPQKQTDIGLVPHSWEVVKIQDLVDQGVIAKPMDGNHGNIHPKSADFVESGIPFVMASDLVDGTIDFNDCEYLRKEQADRLQKGFAYEGDVLISHKATIGVTAIVPKVEHYVMLTPQVTYYRVLDKQRLNNIYLKAFFNTSLFQERFKTVARDGSTRSYIGITKQRELHIAIPKLDEQLEIASCLALVERKWTLAKRGSIALKALFRTLLPELMTGQIRVHEIDELDGLTNA